MNEIKKVNIVPALLFINVIVTIISVYFVVTVSIKINRNQVEVKNNQYTNSSALETFIRKGLVCLFTTSPNPYPTHAQITDEVNNCFKNTPPVR
jgi:hypothetical protein